VQNVLCVTLASQWWAPNKRKGFIIYHPSAAFFSLQQKAVSIRAVQILCAEFGSKRFHAMPASPGISFSAGQSSPSAGTVIFLGQLCFPSLPSALLGALVLKDRPDLTSSQRVKLCSLPPFRLDPEATVAHQKHTPFTALFIPLLMGPCSPTLHVFGSVVNHTLLSSTFSIFQPH